MRWRKGYTPDKSNSPNGLQLEHHDTQQPATGNHTRIHSHGIFAGHSHSHSYGHGPSHNDHEYGRGLIDALQSGGVRGMALLSRSCRSSSLSSALRQNSRRAYSRSRSSSVTGKVGTGKVSLHVESDYELAIETVCESAKGRPEGKQELWCEII